MTGSRKSFYVGQINLFTLRNFIIDHDLTEIDTIWLHPTNFDDIVLEYKRDYAESLTLPFYIFETLIEEDPKSIVPLNRIMLVEIDRLTRNQIYEQSNEPIYATIYRCGWCGNVVDYDGREFDPITRNEKIKILENRNNIVQQKNVYGKCCPNGNQ